LYKLKAGGFQIMKNLFTLMVGRWNIRWVVIGLTATLTLGFGLSANYTNVRAGVAPDSSLCGNGSAPDYGFSYNLRQAHWTVGWENFTSEQAVNEVDTILDKLNADSIAQTMILILPQEKVGNRVNCAVHFLRYMQLGLPEGERKDNGFVFLIVVEPSGIDVHYGVGLGLPALTASELTDLNRTAESTFDTTHSLDQALLTLIKTFNAVARKNYSPLVVASPTPEVFTMPTGEMGIATLCCMVCIGIIILILIVMILRWLIRSGITFDPGNSSNWGGSSGPFGGGGGGGWGGGSSGGGSSPTRGGSGSGRSGRGN
jgi:hypothetical protein